MAVQEGLLRPIEWWADGNIAYTMVGAKTMDEGVYASTLTLITQMEKAGGVDVASVELNSSFKVVVTPAAPPQALVFNGPYGLHTILGFDSDTYGAAASHTAENVSPYIWLNSAHSNDINGWHQRENYFSGGPAVDGSRSGFDLGPILYNKTLDFGYEPILNVFEEAATDAMDTRKGYIYFIRQSKVIQTSHSESSNISAKGFYYFPDLTGIANLDTMDSGGINFAYSSGADTYVFCHYDGEQIEMPVNAFGRARIRYNVSVPIHTAVAPTWLVDGVS